MQRKVIIPLSVTVLTSSVHSSLANFPLVPLLLPSQHVADIVIYVSPEQESSCLLAETSKSLPALSDHLSECPVQRMGHPAVTSN